MFRGCTLPFLFNALKLLSQLYRAYFNHVTTGTNVPLILGFVPVVWRFVPTFFVVLLDKDVELFSSDAFLSRKMHINAFSVGAPPWTPLGVELYSYSAPPDPN